MRWFAIAALVAATGCATSTQFWGSPKVQNGVAGCQAACTAWGMDLAGMVKVGEYSDGCICQVRQRAPAAGQPSSEAPSAPGGPAIAGVWVQMQAAAAAAAQQSAANRAATPPPYVPSSSGPHGFYPGRP